SCLTPLAVQYFLPSINPVETPTSPSHTLSLHDALPLSTPPGSRQPAAPAAAPASLVPDSCSRAAPAAENSGSMHRARPGDAPPRSEEHTSELQSRENLVCRLLLEKKNFITCSVVGQASI